MSYRYDKLNMTATFTTNFFLSNLYTATIAHNTLIPDALVLSAGTFIILCRTKDALAKETVALGLVSTIIDGLVLGNLTIRIFLNEARLMVIFVKLVFTFVSFLKAIFLNAQFSFINLTSHSVQDREVHEEVRSATQEYQVQASGRP